MATGDKIAAITALVGLLQFVALVVTFRIMRRSARQQLRAYVSGRPKFIYSFDANFLASALIEIKNVGQTPAYHLTQRSEISVYPHPLPLDHRFPDLTSEPSPPVALFPGVDFDGTKTASRLFSTEEIERIRTQSAKIYIYGKIMYRDAFRKRRWTTFASSVGADDDTLTKLTSNYGPTDLKITWHHASLGNDAT